MKHRNPNKSEVEVKLGDGVILGNRVRLGNGVTLGDAVRLGNGAILTCVFCAGRDARGYEFLAGHDESRSGEFRIFAGCSDFSVDEARAHWASNPDALRKVEYLVAEAALNGETP